MKASIVTDNPVAARDEAKTKLNRKEVHISAVFYVKDHPELREYVFSTELVQP